MKLKWIKNSRLIYVEFVRKIDSYEKKSGNLDDFKSFLKLFE